jgi:hypothetical protein
MTLFRNHSLPYALLLLVHLAYFFTKDGYWRVYNIYVTLLVRLQLITTHQADGHCTASSLCNHIFCARAGFKTVHKHSIYGLTGVL